MRQGLPLALMHIVEFVEKHGLRESGLFRVGGKVKRCQELRKSFNQGGVPEFDSEDMPTLASLLKLFLRELPGGLIPEPHRTQLLNVFRDSKEEEMNQALRTILNSLPEEQFNVLCYLLFFLSRVAAESHLNLMTSKNLSIVFGPTIFHVPLSPTMVEEQGLCNALTEHLLNNLKHLLPNMYPHVSTSNTAGTVTGLMKSVSNSCHSQKKGSLEDNQASEGHCKTLGLASQDTGASEGLQNTMGPPCKTLGPLSLILRHWGW
ncbi:Protein FAM13A [Anabarilius grahami]|uniref:Protein FAM13A n=1 Tax=Anabarilius grahami TaxID=495550 RepID=A0A3N0YE10_ANAGA|nr:Protein FAM13A [Anabarilius grahami]